MCDFLSFLISVDGKRIVCGDLRSHSTSREVLKLKATEWRGAEWTREDDGKSLSVRIAPQDEHDEKYYKAIILAKWTCRLDAVEACIAMVDRAGGIVDVSGCTALTKLNAPNADRVFAGGCTALTKLDAPNATYVDVNGCAALTKLDAQQPAEK